ncbi:MAG: hypothetical protein M3Q50_12375 [Chloroflexota bacterium]|nr:hypothetical protein [Chloroflexia bacterium]MDQ3227414.1 hypothetical protein [Chloroflexota bacterium]
MPRFQALLPLWEAAAERAGSDFPAGPDDPVTPPLVAAYRFCWVPGRSLPTPP